MRWKFSDHDNHAENAARDVILQRIDNWWRVFIKYEADIAAVFTGRKSLAFDIPGFMRQNLDPINPNLMWEFGRGIHTPHRLVITPEVNHHLRPMVDVLLQRAPKMDWEFYPYRLAESARDAIMTTSGRVGGDITGSSFSAALGRDNTVDLTFHPAHSRADPKKSLHQAFIAAETLLGEEVLDKWIGVIDVATSPARGFLRSFFSGPPPTTGRALSEIRDTITALINTITDQLPNRPLHKILDPEKLCHTFENPKHYTDPDCPPRLDLIAGLTALPDVSLSSHKRGAFFSERFSRCGELFCYIRIPIPFSQFNVRDRMRIHEPLDKELRKAGLGCAFGGGTGRHYSYIDLALTDITAALPLIRTICQQAVIPENSRLLFFDAHLRDEWLAISPPPM